MTERPLVETARREAIVCGVIFLGALLYTITYCAAHGYQPVDSNELKFAFGFPEWVFYGIIVPWGTCTAIAACFSFFFMTDHALGDDANDAAPLDSDGSNTGAGA